MNELLIFGYKYNAVVTVTSNWDVVDPSKQYSGSVKMKVKFDQLQLIKNYNLNTSRTDRFN